MRRPLGKIAFLVLVLALGVVYLTPNALTHAWVRIIRSTSVGSFRRWLAATVHAQATSSPTFTIFDAPGAGTGMLQGTMGTSINASGDIVGVYLTTPNVAHGFVRKVVNGTPIFTTFDAPGAGTGLNQGTFPASINTTGDIAGGYTDNNTAYHGFVRSAATGTITVFDVPGAPTSIKHRGTSPYCIDTAGDIAGLYRGVDDVHHGFLRAANGTFTTFDAPSAGTGLTQGTTPISINPTGTITGDYKDASNLHHGFVRTANGTITTFDAPGATSANPSVKDICCGGTYPLSINSAGDVTGFYTGTNGVFHGFVRAANGTITSFDVTGAGTAGFIPGTLPASINSGGDISGIYTDTNGIRHGFVRNASGTITAPIDAPGASTTGIFSGTALISINTVGSITGTYEDTSGVFHGFVRTPITLKRLVQVTSE